MKLDRDFYSRGSETVARDLLGCFLIHKSNGPWLGAKIVETEAYLGRQDKAAHSYRGRTNRNRAMFGPPGHVYVYLIYGLNCCLNVVTDQIDVPNAVLLRAGQPILGLDQIARNRFEKSYAELRPAQVRNLTNGPGKLCQALGIDLSSYGLDLCGDRLYICRPDKPEEFGVVRCPRINIDYAEEARDWDLRFYIKGNRFVSVLAK